MLLTNGDLCARTMQAYCMLSFCSQMVELADKLKQLNPGGGVCALVQSLFYFLTNAELITWCLLWRAR